MDSVKTLATAGQHRSDGYMSVYSEPASWSDLLQLLAMLSVPATVLVTARCLNRRGERRDRRMDTMHQPLKLNVTITPDPWLDQSRTTTEHFLHEAGRRER
jgi:hypothetical protein